MNKTARPVTNEEFNVIIKTIQTGYITAEGVHVKPNRKVAVCLVMERALGIRIGDVVNLKLSDFVLESGKCKIKIIEGKTKKFRDMFVPFEIYSYIQNYAIENNVRPNQKLFDCTTRLIQHYLQAVTKYLGITGISTHSFRKAYATEIYKQSHDIMLVNKLLQHSDPKITKRYIGFGEEEIEQALQQAVFLPTLG
jgi:integrase